MQEIERKFLIDRNKWTPKTEGVEIIQGYLSTDKKRVVRVRIKGEQAFLTIKGNQQGIVRTELEYEIPLNEAKVMLDMCLDFPVAKTRYNEMHEGHLWEIDIFQGKNRGLYLAEVELKAANEVVVEPEWIIQEVSNDHRYFNAWLAQNPYSSWE